MLKFGLKSKCFALVAAALMAGGVSAADKIRVEDPRRERRDLRPV